MNFPGTIPRVRSTLLAVYLLCTSIALAGHDNVAVDPALKRYAGQITALGDADAKGDIYSFRAKRIRAETQFERDELRGWRLTFLAGKRFSNVFEVRSNTGDEIVVTSAKGPLNGISVKDVFVLENIPPEATKP